MEHNSNDIRFENQKIVDIGIEKEVKKSFIEYSMSVITSRALPDVRDGMKPGQRRIMYAMYEDHLTHDRPFCKSATTVGNVLGRYHPHGDAAVYGTMVRMAQDFSLRYPLVEGHGNFGSVDGDSAAAYRYTEARMSKIADELMRDIEKDVVDFMPNFDNRRKEPTVLPSRFPNLLVNGSVGIAVGMATYIPPHNLREVIDATIYRMENPDCTVPDLMQYIKGPDFPTAATIYGTNGIIEAYMTGKGRVMVRAKAVIEDKHNRIAFTEIPYQVNKSMLCESIAQLVKDKKIEGITGLRDESGRHGMRIVVEYRRDVNPQILLNQLYKYTQLEDTCAMNMLALVDGVPKTMSLPEILDAYIAHQEEVITRRYNFDLKKAKARVHILEGYKIAIDNIDEIVKIMKSSPSIPESKKTLMERFGLSDVQAQAIVDMTLGKLTGLEREKVEEEMARLYALIREIEEILGDINRIKDVIKTEMRDIADRYGDERKTEIVAAENEIVLEDLIERHNCIITLTREGYIKRQASDVYSAQRRGGKGLIGMTTKDEDFIEKVICVGSHDFLLLFTNSGKVHIRKAYMIPEASRTAKGSNLVNILDLASGEKVTAIIAIKSFGVPAPSDDELEAELSGEADTDLGDNTEIPGISENENIENIENIENTENQENNVGDEPLTGDYLVMVTRKGVIKRTALSEYARARRGGKIALTLDEGDELVFVAYVNSPCDIIIASRGGYAVRFPINDRLLRPMGRNARGVRGILLREGDEVVGTAIVPAGELSGGDNIENNIENIENISDDADGAEGADAVSEASGEPELITITENGYGKRTPFRFFRVMKNRGGAGVKCHNINDRTGLLAGISTVTDDDDIFMITDSGTVIRISAADIPAYSRGASGVIVMRLADGSKIVNFTKVPSEPLLS